MALGLHDDAVAVAQQALDGEDERPGERGGERTEQMAGDGVAAAMGAGDGRRPDERVDDVGREELGERRELAAADGLEGVADLRDGVGVHQFLFHQYGPQPRSRRKIVPAIARREIN